MHMDILQITMEKFRKLMKTKSYAIAPNYREVHDNINTVYSCIDVNTVTTIKYIQEKMDYGLAE